MYEIARTGRTSHPLAQDIYTAQMINRLCGTTISPYDVGQLNDELIEMSLALTLDLPAMKAGMQKSEQSREAWRAQMKAH